MQHTNSCVIWCVNVMVALLDHDQKVADSTFHHVLSRKESQQVVHRDVALSLPFLPIDGICAVMFVWS